MCRAFSLVPALGTRGFLPSKIPPIERTYAENRARAVLLEEESPREVNERRKRERKKKKDGKVTRRRVEKERGVIFTRPRAPGKSVPSTTIRRPDRIGILEQIPRVSNEFHVKPCA